MSRLLEEKGLVCLFFNHIPETKVVDDLYLDCQNEAHRGLLGAKVIGFHTKGLRRRLSRLCRAVSAWLRRRR